MAPATAEAFVGRHARVIAAACEIGAIGVGESDERTCLEIFGKVQAR